MCCHTGRCHGFQNRGQQHACFCGCEGPGVFSAGWANKKQRIAWLQAQLEELRDETRSLEARILQIQKEK